MATRAARAAGAVGRHLIPNAVALRIRPAPAGIGESREVLRVIQNFGEVLTFKSLRYEAHNPVKNCALAIFRSSESATKLIDASPITFELEQLEQNLEAARADQEHSSSASKSSEDENHEALHDEEKLAGSCDSRLPDFTTNHRRTDAEEMTRPTQLISTSDLPRDTTSSSNEGEEQPMPSLSDSTKTLAAVLSSAPRSKDPPTPNKTHTEVRTFSIDAEAWNGNHYSYIQQSPFFGPFQRKREGAIFADLIKRVPRYQKEVFADIGFVTGRQRDDSLRVLAKRADAIKNRATLRQLWEEGNRETGV